MKYVFLLFILIPNISSAFTFEVSNTALQNSTSIPLGIIDLKLCQSSKIIAMNAISEGSQDGICIAEKTKNYCKINILVPLKISMTGGEGYNVKFSKGSFGSDFTKMSLRNLRDHKLDGGLELLDVSPILMNNETIYGELEITADVCGPGTANSYSNSVIVDITPTI